MKSAEPSERWLPTTASIAQNASLTGALRDGARQDIRQYNAVLQRLSAAGLLPQDLFPPLEEDQSFDEVGVTCKQLFGYLKELTAEGTPEQSIKDITVGDSLRETGQEIRAIMSKKGPAEVARALREMAERIETTQEKSEEETG